jgi:hypothetical protein
VVTVSCGPCQSQLTPEQLEALRLEHDHRVGLRRTAKVMCMHCPHYERDRAPWRCMADPELRPRDTIIELTVHGQPSCPLGRHPDHAGLVRWMGTAWIGVPEPLRWRHMLTVKREPPWCGCIANLKHSPRLAKWAPWLGDAMRHVHLLRRALRRCRRRWQRRR